MPDIDALARNNRSLYLGLRRLRRKVAPVSGGPALVTLDGGLVQLVEALATRLGYDELRLGNAVRNLSRVGTRYWVELADGQELSADAVILATPAFGAESSVGRNRLPRSSAGGQAASGLQLVEREVPAPG